MNWFTKNIVLAALVAAICPSAYCLADDPEPSYPLAPPADHAIDAGGEELWLVYQAEDDGVLCVLTHDCPENLMFTIYSEAWEGDPLGTVNRNMGRPGNEIAVIQVEEGNVYYFKITHSQGGTALPQTIPVLTTFAPGATINETFYIPSR